MEDPTEECFAQFELDLDLDMIREQVKALLDPTLGMQTKSGETAEISFPNPSPSTAEPFNIENNNVEEEDEQIEPLSTPSLSNDKEVSTQAHSFITIPLETFHQPQASFIQCLKEPSYAKTLKDLCKQVSKSRNHCPKKIPLSNKVGYLRWQNILLERY